jgi:predicted lipid-binding transport protein (Tim44 family)
MSLDPLNILLLAVVLVVFWRLKSVLGTRTGNERPPIEPFKPKQEPVSSPEQNGTVLRFPDAGRQDRPPAPADETAAPVWTGYAEAGTPLAKGLEDVNAADPAFSPKSFLEGAKFAYEMIVDAFAKGDKSALKDLLSSEVYAGFANAIDTRSKTGQRVESRFVGIDKARLMSVTLVGSRASVTVEFDSELISATYAAGGEVVEGDPTHIRQVTDVWTFERDVTSRNPNWKLSATQAPA